MRLWINTLDFYEKTRQKDYEPVFQLIMRMRLQEKDQKRAKCEASTKNHCGGNCGYYIACLHSALAKRMLTSCAVLLTEGMHTYNDVDDAKEFLKYFTENEKRIPTCAKNRFYLKQSHRLLAASLKTARHIIQSPSVQGKKIIFKDRSISWWVARELGGWNSQDIAKQDIVKPLVKMFASDCYQPPSAGTGDASKVSMNLVEWVDKVKQIQARNPFHVLCSEWVALAIFRKILFTISKGNQSSASSVQELIPLLKSAKPLQVSPYNFYLTLPDKLNNELINDPIKTSLDWENIHALFRTDFVEYSAKQRDFRFQPYFIQDMNSAQIELFGLGLLLSCLVRHSFDFDPIWEREGFQYDAYFMVQRLMNRTPRSTFTSRIIEGCLYDGIMNRPYYDFTSIKSVSSPYDPLRIDDLQGLHKYTVLAMKELVINQSMLAYKKPRQLIPIFEASGEQWNASHFAEIDSNPAHEQE